MDDSNYLVRPRLNDYYGIFLNQAKVDFAIPYLNEDIPLYVDPFRLWQSFSKCIQLFGKDVFRRTTGKGCGTIKENIRM